MALAELARVTPLPQPLPRRRRRFPLAAAGLIAPAVLVVAVGAIAPLIVLIFYSTGLIGTTVRPNLDSYAEVLTDGFFLEAYARTLLTALEATVGALLIGVPLAFLISRAHGWARTLLTALVVLPLLVNMVVRNLGWVVALSDNGVLNRLLGLVGLHQNFVGTTTGIMIVLMHVGLPMVILPLLTTIDRLEPAQREAAAVLGAHPVVVFVRITLPSIAGGLVVGATLVFLIAVGSLVTPLFLGQGKVFVLPTLIVQQIQLPMWQRAAALSLILFAIVVTSAFLFQKLGSRLSKGRSRRARSRGPLVPARPVTRMLTRLNGLGRGTAPARVLRACYLVFMVLFLLFPMAVVVKAGLDSSESLQPGFDGFTLRWIGDALSPGGYLPQLLFSLRLAVSATLVTLGVALAAAWALARLDFKGRDAILSFLISPLLIPQAALAVGFVLFFLLLGSGPSFGRMLFAHVVVALPFMTRILVSAFETVDPRLEEAGRALGAPMWRVFLRVTLPLVRPGLFSAVLFGFLVSFDETAISVLLATGDTTTLPVRLLSQMSFQPTPVGAAMATVLVVAVTAIVVPLERRFGIASSAVPTTGARQK